MATVLGIIRQTEREYPAPCRVGELRFARLDDREAAMCEKRLANKSLPGWQATVIRDGKRPKLRYSKT